MNEPLSLSAEKLSALVDGDLLASVQDELADLLADPNTVQTWHLYHIVGDVLRSEELAPTAQDLAFWERLEQKMALEPSRPAGVTELAANTGVQPARGQAANASVLRWKWVAGLACTVLVAAAGLGMWPQGVPDGSGQATAVADIPQEVAAGAGTSVMLRDPQLDALMAAHQQLGGHSALQMPSGFLRNATYERPAQ